MENLVKKQIAEHLRRYCERMGSQSKAAKSLRNVSSATISHMLGGEWSLITDEMWRRCAAQIGVQKQEWVSVETRDYKLLCDLYDDAQTNALVMAVVGEAGTGKSFAAKCYAESRREVYVLHCADFWTKRLFLQELLRTMGRDSGGATIADMMAEAAAHLKEAQAPLIILDEADKLGDSVMFFFITLYNQLEDHCGIILQATDHLKKRIDRGRKLNKKGYKEIYIRIGRKFIELKGLGVKDISEVCRANGIDDAADIKEVVADCEGDMRRVKRKIHALKRLAERNTEQLNSD